MTVKVKLKVKIVMTCIMEKRPEILTQEEKYTKSVTIVKLLEVWLDMMEQQDTYVIER